MKTLGLLFTMFLSLLIMFAAVGCEDVSEEEPHEVQEEEPAHEPKDPEPTHPEPAPVPPEPVATETDTGKYEPAAVIPERS